MLKLMLVIISGSMVLMPMIMKIILLRMTALYRRNYFPKHQKHVMMIMIMRWHFQEKRLSKSSERRHRWTTGAESIASSWWLNDDENNHYYNFEVTNVMMTKMQNLRAYSLSLHSLWTLPIVILQVQFITDTDHQCQIGMWWLDCMKK